MTGVFTGLAAANGKIPVVIVTSLPANAVSRNGILVSPAGEVYAVADTNQPRSFRAGIAFEQSTGLLILGSDANAPYSVPMGGMFADNKGAFLATGEDPDVIHQAIGLKTLLHAGSVTAEGLAPQIVNQLDASQDQVNKTGDVVNSVVATDGRQYDAQGGSGVTHGVATSPTGLDAYAFDGTAGSFLKLVSGYQMNQPLTVFIAMRRTSSGKQVVFDNME